MKTWIFGKICAWAHGGGDVKRDSSGRINWQCRRCGRWAEPVSQETEQRVIERRIEAALRAKNGGGE